MSVTGQTRKCGLVLEEWLRLEVHKAQTKPFMKSARVDLVYRNNYYGCKEIGEPAPFWYTSPASAKPESRRICVRVQREWKRMIGMEDYVSSPLNDVYRLPVGDARSLLEKAMSKEEFHKINAAIKCLGRPEIAWTYIDGELGNEPQVAYLNKKREATNEALRAIDDRAREKRNAEDEARFLKYRLEYAKNPSSIGAFTLRLSNDKINKIIKRTIVELKDYVAEQQLAHPKTQYMIYVCLSVEETMAFPPPETTNRDFQEKEKKDKFVGSCSREGNDEFKGCFYEPLNAAIYQGGGRACPRVGEELNIALGPRYILDNLDPRWVDIGATHSNLEAQRLESGMQTAVHAAKLLNLHLTPAVKAGNAFNYDGEHVGTRLRIGIDKEKAVGASSYTDKPFHIFVAVMRVPIDFRICPSPSSRFSMDHWPREHMCDDRTLPCEKAQYRLGLEGILKPIATYGNGGAAE
mmetsp:Transcript_70778/g.198027  ORF Transcript_70778/g.198027 Transcript_70778/m.198027 type:complete len:464 (-) Transcript_70778:441-1832(-)